MLAEYDPEHDLLEKDFMMKGRWYQRKDLEVIKNSRGDVLQCSHYMPVERPEGKPLPCVIYCHGNSGCRADGSEAAIMLLPSNITVFTLDFSGSGLSGGEHVTLGWNEKDDLKAVVEFLRQDGNISLIGLWGRSMGAVTRNQRNEDSRCGIMISFQEKENHDGREDSSSSPDMISFDLSNGDHDQYPPQLAMALDDDQYLEYHLEDIPSNAEEEERMLMKAVMESLKDLEVQSLEKKESPEKRVLGSNSFQTAQEPLLSRKESTSTQANQSETTDSASSPATVGGDVAPSSSESKAPNGTSDSLTAPVDASVPGCTSQNASENGDMSADTKATVTVERTSSAPGKVFDGLIRKWDLNFFKNNK
ncbi:hypothetical protein F2Q70_00030357 [Brassica cretica]|uniref:Serine aminopeptidase S33 domain-containing protein n=1 Tax=Brassica cretica TaxID=69181 RepID=A0A8S9FJ39_BRACR|nr:hypothetical protein F2Q70_00030357 [Brassica cretica]